ncbi:MAG: histone-lysine N-methyltransferase EHMT1-like isoform [Schlesneria sp.]|nr:histone-lysine N-methyltransferase EHMT1-like isoform [Schlesneria sp.]
MESLLAAIVDDDRQLVRRLLKQEPALATRLIDTAHLYEASIFHWIYVGDTVLHLAAAGYRVEIVADLIKAGADPNAASNHRRGAPLHYAADGYIDGPVWDAKRQVKTIATLLEAGASINLQDKNGATPLHRAVRTRCADAVQCLLDAGCDPLMQNNSGSTPFHLAVQNTGRGGSGSDEAKAAQRVIIATFLKRGISPALKDGNGKSVLDCTRSEPIRALLT